jgi:hypothetical protein
VGDNGKVWDDGHQLCLRDDCHGMGSADVTQSWFARLSWKTTGFDSNTKLDVGPTIIIRITWQK